MNKKLCWFLDIIYFLIMFYIIYRGYDTYHYMFFSDHNVIIMNELQRLIFYGKDILIFLFSVLVTFLVDFSFVSKILTHFKFSSKSQKKIFIIVIASVILAFVVLQTYNIFVVGNYKVIFP